MLELVVISLLNGLVYGLLLFMLSSGLTLIFSMMGVLNFAHASMFMLGAYMSFQITKSWSFWPALILAPILVGAVGAVVERWGLRFAHRSGHVAELLFTFGLSYLIEEIVIMLWGRNPLEFRVPASLDFPAFTLFSTSFPFFKVFIVVLSIAMFGGLWLALKRTRIGLVIQAALTHPNMAAMLGHDMPRVFMLVFAVGTALAALAGVVYGFAFVTQPGMAAQLGPIVFVVVVLGGMGSLAGAFIGSIGIGVIQTFSVAINYSFNDLLGAFGMALTRQSAFHEVVSIKLAQAAPMLPYLLLVLMLIFRPRGLMGTRDE
jgi:branched-chain amino acid transport system permease protein